jgi:hypothetical protein
VHCPVESFGLVFLNPPYDWTTGETRSERTERVFLAHTYRWLKAAGVLVLVVPAVHVRECGEILASQFKDTRIFRLTNPESVRYRQVVVLATRRSRREREQLRDYDIVVRRAQFGNIGRNYERLAPLGDISTPWYSVPEVSPAKLEIAAFHLTRSRTCFPAPRPTAKPLESSFLSRPYSRVAR